MTENFTSYSNLAVVLAMLASLSKFMAGAAVATFCLWLGRRWGRKEAGR